MQRVLVKSLSVISNRKSVLNICLRCTSTQNNIFTIKSDFPARHIGPRKTDVVSMLDLLGFKVINCCFNFHFKFIENYTIVVLVSTKTFFFLF